MKKDLLKLGLEEVSNKKENREQSTKNKNKMNKFASINNLEK